MDHWEDPVAKLTAREDALEKVRADKKLSMDRMGFEREETIVPGS